MKRKRNVRNVRNDFKAPGCFNAYFAKSFMCKNCNHKESCRVERERIEN